MPNLDNSCIGYKIQLFPTTDQLQIINKYFGACRYVYNYTLDMQSKYLSDNGTLMTKIDANNLLTQMKKDVEWLKALDSTSLKISSFDATQSYNNYMNGYSNLPNYRTKKSSNQSFPIRADRLKVFSRHIYCPGIGDISCSRIPNDNIIGQGYKSRVNPDIYRKYYDARISYDGYKYWISFTMERDIERGIEFNSIMKKPFTIHTDEVIGIDIGASGNNWIVDSNNVTVALPDTTLEDKKIDMFMKKYQHKAQMRAKSGLTGETQNMLKIKKEINKYYDRKRNKRRSAMFDYIAHNIIDRHPSKVVIEDVSASDWMCTDQNIPAEVRNKINANVQNSGIYDFQHTLQYKCDAHGIELVKADRNYPSTQLCSNCGSINYIGTNKIYRCHNCGFVMNRDINAALNLKAYGEQ